MKLLIVAHLRGLLRTPLLSLLAVAGIALAVTVVFGVDLALGGARAGFGYAWRQLHGEATHYLAPVSGTTFPEARYFELRRSWRRGAAELSAVRSMTPVVHGEVTLAERGAEGGATLMLLGVDLVGRTAASRQTLDLDSAGVMLGQPRAVMMGWGTAERAGLSTGDVIRLRDGERHLSAEVAGILGDAGDPRYDSLLLADIATAQELLALTGRLHRVELVLEGMQPGARGTQLLDRLFPGIMRADHSATVPWLPPLPEGLRAHSVADREAATRSLADAFYFNLGALSLLAMLVALFLINQSMHLSVVRRSTQMGRLRALGITPAELESLIVMEAFVMGIAGTAIGILGGWMLAGYLLELVTRTVSDLYFVIAVRQLHFDPVVVTKSIVLGISVSAIGAWWPARQAAAAAVVEQTRRVAQEQRLRPGAAVLIASAWFALAWMLVRWEASAVLGGLAAVGAVLMGAATLMKPLVGAMSFLFVLPGAGFGHVGRMSARQLRRNLSRAGVAVAALMIAGATSLGMGIMIESFRDTLEDWLGQRLVADVYLEDISGAGFSEAFASELVARAGVTGAVLYGSANELFEGQRVSISVMGSALQDGGAQRAVGARYVLLEGERSADAVMVSESLSVRHDRSVGDSIRLDSRSGAIELRVSGVFREYGNGQGRVVMDAELYRLHWGEPQFVALALFGDGGDDFAHTLAALEARDDLRLRRRESLRRYSLEIFDRTFSVTRVLRWLALVVAFAGVQSALLALQLDRAREFAVAHALGFTRRELASLALLDAVGLGLCAGLMALPVGAAISWLLVHVVNLRAFGWTLDLTLDPRLFAQTLALAALAGLLAGLTPALRLWRRAPDPRAILRDA